MSDDKCPICDGRLCKDGTCSASCEEIRELRAAIETWKTEEEEWKRTEEKLLVQIRRLEQCLR